MARLRDFRDSPHAVEASLWYIVLFVATAAAKLAGLSSVYRHSDAFVLDEVTSGGARLSRVHLLALILARDAVETGLLALGALALALATRRFGSAAFRLVAVALFVVVAVNHLSFEQLGTFASPDVLATAFRWVSLHPATVRGYLTPGAGLVALLGVVGVLGPGLAASAAPRSRALAFARDAAPAAAVTVFAAGIVCAALARIELGPGAFAAEGYWEHALAAAFRADDATPLAGAAPSTPELLAGYRRLAFVRPTPAAPKLSFPGLEARLRKRHVIVVGLETAPRAFYPLTTATDLPTFHRMTARAIVSDHHYTTSSYTRIANFSILSGLYAPPSGLPVRFGRIATDGLAAVLRTRGYDTTYVDSWVLDWLPGSGERDQARMLGFDTVLDSAVRRDDGVYEVLVQGEKVAFDTALARVLAAEARGRKALVFVGTMLGHSPWPAAEDRQGLGSAARLHEIALVFDGLFEHLLQGLSAHGLGEDVLVLVMGDHGLRYAAEFESLGLPYSHSDLSFDVPFLLYAPGLVDGTIRAPFATSHVDVTPTVLHLVGESTEGLLHDGQYILDGRLEDRILYLSNSRLGPLDGLRWNGLHFTAHALSGVAEVGDGAEPSSMLPLDASPLTATLPERLRDPAKVLAEFAAHADRVAGRLLARGAESPGPPEPRGAP